MSKNSSKNGHSGEDIIDEGLYSRQLYVLGHTAMMRMKNSNILICGLGGLGVEIAKNITLAGVKSVTLHDERNVTYDDLSSQFFLTEEDVGKNRAVCSSASMRELNTYVSVNVHVSKLDEEFLRNFQVVVLTDSDHDEQIQIGKFCHQHGIKFIVAQTNGVFGKIFCDFGKSFQIHDVNGQQAKSSMISYISNDADGVVTTFEDQKHDLEDGSYVTFSEIKGMTELNGKEFKIRLLGPYSFAIGDTRTFGKYVNGGILTEVKKDKLIDFEPIEVASEKLILFDGDSYFGEEDPRLIDNHTVHIAFQALGEFKKQSPTKSPPRPWNLQDAEEFVNISKRLNSARSDPFALLNNDLLRLFSCVAEGNLSPVQSVIGGTAAQEIMKACSGKFHPIVQYFYFDCRDVLPDRPLVELAAELAAELAPVDKSPNRYTGQTNVFGGEFQSKLDNYRCFLVGTGALGCEYIKNFSMMGMSSGAKGLLTLTDMDTIEKSNLNRQFLFRSWDVNKFKAEVAYKAAKKMNPKMNIKVNLTRVGPENETTYNEDFYNSLDVICNALDNVKTRLYIDSKSIEFQKALIESGTLGTEGNVQVVVPFLTEAYSSSQDPPEKSIPLCTLKIFPNAIEHTIQWARDKFEGLFTNPAVSAINYMKNPNSFLNGLNKLSLQQSLDELKQLEKVLVTETCKTFEDCVRWARKSWEENFHNIIDQLLYNFPPDQLTANGVPFWSGPKRCPHVLEFDVNNKIHFDYVYTAANLKALMHGVKQNRDAKYIEQLLKEVKVEKYTRQRSIIKIKLDENEEESDMNDEEEEELLRLRQFFLHAHFKNVHLIPIEFEKDDDTNLHMDFITACSNLRAENYNIAPTNKHKSKLIAGKIIPAIATTTSVIVGLDCIELYKIIQGHSKLEKFKNYFINLALPLFQSSEPMPALKNKFNDVEWSFWDRIQIKGDKTLFQLLEYFREEYKLNVTMIGYDVVTLFSSYLSKEKYQEREHKKITEIWEIIKKEKLPATIKSLTLSVVCEDLAGNEVDIPYVKYII